MSKTHAPSGTERKTKHKKHKGRDMEKGTEVEMEQIRPAEKSEDEDATEDTGQETQDKKETNEKENVYSTLNSTTGDMASNPTSYSKHHEDVNGRVHLYRRMSAALFLLCVLLLAVVLALAIKLSEVQSKQECPDVERTTMVEVWSREKCDLMYPRQAQEYNGHLCSECGKGWLKFENSCYFLSKYRLTWQESREQCQKWGGDLAVIINDRVQTFLTEKGLMFYWIGLHDLGRQQWTWINNTVLTKSYWGQPLKMASVFS